MQLIAEKNNYDDFLKARFISGNFLQSSVWQDFLEQRELRNWQLAIVDKQITIATCLAYEMQLPLGKSYLYSPRGPIFSADLDDRQRQEALQLILSKLRDVTIDTKKRQEIFYKLEPSNQMYLLPEFIKSHDLQPRDTLILDLELELKNLLAEMHAKTRYNISLAKRKGVEISFSTKEEDIKHFLDLVGQTAKRNQINSHSAAHYRLLWKILLKHKVGQLCIAKVAEQVVAVNIVVKFGSAVTYLHGASDYNSRKYMAPHLLQWEIIKQAKEQGYKIYDFWGIAPEDGSKVGWAGFTRFKKGFGGRVIKSPGAHNFIYDKSWYGVYSLMRKLRRLPQ
ncbi:peptidoglycan bridge formation glycyltransferase FemA/FemB family protein [Candidatus Parcubacteria bacterium]|jgi:peptidoglycan pentaglycine glycine transferase (the first glycine)|nr:peptidoglycan bridge formation glycyltransferase FemA/FemB family protein [Candidatus Parcubacteria bacterium]